MPEPCKSYSLKVAGIVAKGPNGIFECGSEESAFQGNIDITLFGNKNIGHGEKGIVATQGGSLLLQGKPGKAAIYKLAKTVWPGNEKSDEIVLNAAPNWQVGDKIVVAATGFDPNQTETFTIKDINGNTVGLDSKVNFMHWGQTKSYTNQRKHWVLDERAEVINLSRNITIQGDAGKSY